MEPRRASCKRVGRPRGSRQDMQHSDECMRQWSTARRFVNMVEAMGGTLGTRERRARTGVPYCETFIHMVDREGDPHLGPAVDVAQPHRTLVRPSDRRHDRQPQTAAAGRRATNEPFGPSLEQVG